LLHIGHDAAGQVTFHDDDDGEDDDGKPKSDDSVRVLNAPLV
jgi:hypothetical protein